jgi:hypothetical protein
MNIHHRAAACGKSVTGCAGVGSRGELRPFAATRTKVIYGQKAEFLKQQSVVTNQDTINTERTLPVCKCEDVLK